MQWKFDRKRVFSSNVRHRIRTTVQFRVLAHIWVSSMKTNHWNINCFILYYQSLICRKDQEEILFPRKKLFHWFTEVKCINGMKHGYQDKYWSCGSLSAKSTDYLTNAKPLFSPFGLVVKDKGRLVIWFDDFLKINWGPKVVFLKHQNREVTSGSMI